MAHQLSIAITGYGAIAKYVISKILPHPAIDITAIVTRQTSFAPARQFADNRFQICMAVDEFDVKPDLLVDCAGHEGLRHHVPTALRKGIDVISLSTGALADPDTYDQLEEAAVMGKSRLKFLNGAVGGIDALGAASMDEISKITYKAHKPPQGWVGTYAEQHCDLSKIDRPFTHFTGTARKAAQLYPKNANIAATVALASLGLDQVMVELIADPAIMQNIHEIEAEGCFGHMEIRIKGNPLPDNPRSSALAAMSVVKELERRIALISL